MKTLVQIAGISQLILVAASLAIPKVLGWREETSKLKPLTRQVFWTYAAYIWAINLSFGLLSALRADILLDGSTLARVVCAFIASYWGARLLIQLVWFDRSERPQGAHIKLAEAGLTMLFACLTAVYAVAVLP